MIKCDFCGKLIPKSLQGRFAISYFKGGNKDWDNSYDYRPIDVCKECLHIITELEGELYEKTS
jgi:hypothetical protein